MTLKASPLCSRDDGKEIYFTVKLPPRKLRVTYPRAYLNAACGEAAPEKARKAWVSAERPALLAALADQKPTDTAVLIEEIR